VVAPLSLRWRHTTTPSERRFLRSAVVHHSVTPEAQGGFHVFLLWTDRAFSSTLVGIFDTNGTLVASRRVANRLWAAEFMNSTTMYSLVSIGDTGTDINRRNGVWLWNVATDAEQRIHLRGSHHMIEYDPLHRTWLTLQQSNARLWTHGAYVQLQVDDIWEFDMAGHVVWKWYAREHLPQFTNLHADNINPHRDFVHANTLHNDVHEGVLYYNSRHMDTVWKIDKVTGECLWAIGRYGTVPMYDLSGRLVRQLFAHSHGLTRVDDDTFVTFDNAAGMGRNFVSLCTRSRLLEFRYDPQRRVAKETWLGRRPRHLPRGARGRRAAPQWEHPRGVREGVGDRGGPGRPPGVGHAGRRQPDHPPGLSPAP